MANIAIQNGMNAGGAAGDMTVRTALRLAWVTWVTLLIIPFGLFLVAVWTLMIRDGNASAVHTEEQPWFLAASAYLLVVVPVSFFWRGRLFKSYWSGHPIAPAKYLHGMLAIWAALEFGGIIALLGCFIDHSLLPNLLPALVAFMFFVTLWPSGKAMVSSVGQEEDASLYEEPR